MNDPEIHAQDEGFAIRLDLSFDELLAAEAWRGRYEALGRTWHFRRREDLDSFLDELKGLRSAAQ